MPLFLNLEIIWNALLSTYNRELSALCWSDEIPDTDEIIKVFIQIREFLIEFDKHLPSHFEKDNQSTKPL